MAKDRYQQGDVVWRHGTIGARREPTSHAVVILAVNNEERLGGEQFYTCALISTQPMGRAGTIEIRDSEGEDSYVNLSQIMIAGEGSFQTAPGGNDPKVGSLSELERFEVRAGLEALLVVDKNHFGKVFYSVTPAHDGSRGKPNRPYVAVGSVGKGTDILFTVPVSSSPGAGQNGIPIQDLEEAGLRRDNGEESFMRTAWASTISSRTASHPAGRLSERDRQNLYPQFVKFKRELIAGEIGKMAVEDRGLKDDGVNVGQSMFPSGLKRATCFPAHGKAGVGGRQQGLE